MNLEGCSNPGFSYTHKYKKAMISLFDFISKQNDKIVGYTGFQEEAESSILSDSSEIRMLIPFMIKNGIINQDNVYKGETRIRKLRLNDEFFTVEGKCFLKFLKIESKIGEVDTSISQIIKRIYLKFGIIQFEFLREFDEYIYNDLYVFLKKYKTIDKNEFFFLTHCRKNNILNKLDNYIIDYRNKKINDINIINNVNAYRYITNYLLQIGILVNVDGYLKLSEYYSSIKAGEKYEFK